MKYCLLFLVFIISVSGFAQKAKDTTALVVFPHKGKIMLKWMPISAKNFLDNFNYGYNLYRSEVSLDANGKPILQEKVKLNSLPIKPKPKNELAALDSSSRNATLFGYNTKEQLEKSSKVKNYTKTDNDDYIYAITIFGILSNNKLAEALGYYWEDKSADPTKTYYYTLQQIITMQDIGFMGVNLKKKPAIFKPYNLAHSQKQKAVTIKWFSDTHVGSIYYNIYRATSANGNYQKLNKKPISNFTTSKDKNIVFFIDTVPEYNKTYYYKATSVNMLEVESEPSKVLPVLSTRYLETLPKIVQGMVLNKNEIEIKWEMDFRDQPYVKGFAVYKSRTAEGEYKCLTPSLLSKNTFVYKDKKDIGTTNYYRISAVGLGGDSLISVMKGVYLIDSVPPAMPVFISGICDTNGIVKIKWKMNKEADFIGYRVFKTYNVRHEPVRMTPGHIGDTLFIDTIPKNLSDKKVYYTVSSIDMHFNPSQFPPYICVRIPDKLAPIAPYFTDYNVDKKGINLFWEHGKDADLAQVQLQRKSPLDFDFQLVVKYEGDSLNILNYRDTLTKTGINYQYRLLAIDSTGLRKYSDKTLGVQQMDKFVPEAVKNLVVISSKPNQLIKLTWEFAGRAKSFRILRAKNNGPLESYDFVPGDVREFYDKYLVPKVTYTYQVQATYFDERRSYLSEKIIVKY